MGQFTYGIMLGCRADAFREMNQGGWEIVDAYTDAFRDALKVGPVLSLSHGEDGDTFAGFWIAVGASGKPDVPLMPSGIALDQIECADPWARLIALAREQWPRFARWVELNHSIHLPSSGRLFLVETEAA